MLTVYACLLGNWVCLNDDPDCVMGTDMESPYKWFSENPKLWSPFNRGLENDFYELDFIEILFRGTTYRISPIFIQIVQK